MLCKRFIFNFVRRHFFSTCREPLFIIQSNLVNSVDCGKKYQYMLQRKIFNLYTIKRFKHKKELVSSKTEDFEDNVQEDDVSDRVEPYEKVLTRNVNSMRIDAVVQSALGLSRNKVDVAFFESKLRLNGKKVLKKSVLVKEDDEVDFLIGKSNENPNFILVNRIRIVSVTDVASGYRMKLVRDKSLLIEDYEDHNLQ